MKLIDYAKCIQIEKERLCFGCTLLPGCRLHRYISKSRGEMKIWAAYPLNKIHFSPNVIVKIPLFNCLFFKNYFQYSILDSLDFVKEIEEIRKAVSVSNSYFKDIVHI